MERGKAKLSLALGPFVFSVVWMDRGSSSQDSYMMCKGIGTKKHAVVDTCPTLGMSPGVTRRFLIQIWTSSFLPGSSL